MAKHRPNSGDDLPNRAGRHRVGHCVPRTPSLRYWPQWVPTRIGYGVHGILGWRAVRPAFAAETGRRRRKPAGRSQDLTLISPGPKFGEQVRQLSGTPCIFVG
jgi:hypothetical protein